MNWVEKEDEEGAWILREGDFICIIRPHVQGRFYARTAKVYPTNPSVPARGHLCSLILCESWLEAQETCHEEMKRNASKFTDTKPNNL